MTHKRGTVGKSARPDNLGNPAMKFVREIERKSLNRFCIHVVSPRAPHLYFTHRAMFFCVRRPTK